MKAQKGDTVKVHYTGRLADGTIFDSSSCRKPLKVTLGCGEVIPGFERAIIGLKPGTMVIENIPAKQAFGAKDESMIWELSRDELRLNGEVRIGQDIKVSPVPGRKEVDVRVVNISEDRITVDANHPLAGKDLTFEIELLEIA